MLNEVYKAKRGPKALIDHFYEKVGIIEALIVVFVSVILNILFLVVLKMPNIGVTSVTMMYSSILVNWLFLGIVIFLVMYFIRGVKKLPKLAFQRTLAALASFRIPAIIYSIISAVIILIFLGSFIPAAQAVSVNPSLITSTTLFPKITTFNLIGIILLALLTLFAFVYWIIMFYEFSEIIFDVKNPIAKIALIILIFTIAILLSAIFM